MKIYKIENHNEIIENEHINRIIRYDMFNPTDGRIKSAAEGIYGKEQGRFYVCEKEHIVGLIGVRRVDNAFVEIMHLAVDEPYRKQGIARALVEYVRQSERVDEIISEADDSTVDFYRALDFQIEEELDPVTDVVRFICRLKG